MIVVLVTVGIQLLYVNYSSCICTIGDIYHGPYSYCYQGYNRCILVNNFKNINFFENIILTPFDAGQNESLHVCKCCQCFCGFMIALSSVNELQLFMSTTICGNHIRILIKMWHQNPSVCHISGLQYNCITYRNMCIAAIKFIQSAKHHCWGHPFCIQN